MDNATGFDLPDGCAETIFDIYNEALSNIARQAGESRGLPGPSRRARYLFRLAA